LNYGKKSDFNFWNIVTVVGLILLGINYINKKDSSKKVRNKVDAPTFKYPRTPSLDLNTSKLELSESSKIKVKGRFPNLKIELPKREMLNLRYDSLLKSISSPRRDSLRLILRKALENTTPKDDTLVRFNHFKHGITEDSIKSIEGFKNVNRRNKNIVDDIKNNKDND